MCHSATKSLFSRRDVIIVASVSAIFALADPTSYGDASLTLASGQIRNRNKILHHLVNIHYRRNDYELQHGTFRVRGDTLEIRPPYNDRLYRVELFGDETDRLVEIDSLSGEILDTFDSLTIYPAHHIVTEDEPQRHRTLGSTIIRFSHIGYVSSWYLSRCDRNLSCRLRI